MLSWNMPLSFHQDEARVTIVLAASNQLVSVSSLVSHAAPTTAGTLLDFLVVNIRTKIIRRPVPPVLSGTLAASRARLSREIAETFSKLDHSWAMGLGPW
jgi:hypothetical protein